MKSLLLSALLITTVQAEEKTPQEVIIVAGQSNAVGFDTKAAEVPSAALEKKTPFWFRVGDPPPDEHDSTCGGKWLTLGVQPKGNALQDTKTRQYGNFAFAEGGWGVEMGLVAGLQDTKGLGIIKTAWSGTGFEQDWFIADEGKPHGPCYRVMLDEIKAATAKLPVVRFSGFVWVQGESDSPEKCIPHYEAKLGKMLQQLRLDLKAPQMPVLLGVNTRFGNKEKILPAMQRVIDAQKALAKSLPHCAYVDTDGASVVNGAHFDSAGTFEVGKRFAAAYAALALGTSKQ
jgi:hypothetical protein